VTPLRSALRGRHTSGRRDGRGRAVPPCDRYANDDAELFLYPGKDHYFADSSLPSYDVGATALLTQRVLDFLETR
jgi:dienelactone hydrolase